MNDVRKIADLGPLHELLLKACPKSRKDESGTYVRDRARGKRSIAALAQWLGCVPATIYVWINKDHVPPQHVRKIVELSEGRVSLRDLDPFVYGVDQKKPNA